MELITLKDFERYLKKGKGLEKIYDSEGLEIAVKAGKGEAVAYSLAFKAAAGFIQAFMDAAFDAEVKPAEVLQEIFQGYVRGYQAVEINIPLATLKELVAPFRKLRIDMHYDSVLEGKKQRGSFDISLFRGRKWTGSYRLIVAEQTGKIYAGVGRGKGGPYIKLYRMRLRRRRKKPVYDVKFKLKREIVEPHQITEYLLAPLKDVQIYDTSGLFSTRNSSTE